MRVSRKLLLLFSILMIIPGNSPADTDDVSKTVRILFTNNSNGKLKDCNCPNDPYGGLAERVALIREYRGNYHDFLLFDSGGYLGLSSVIKTGPAVFRMMEIMEYDAYGIGDQELYFSFATFMERFEQWTGPIVNASLGTNEKKQVFTPYKVFISGSVRIGVIGLASQETFKFFPDENRDFSVEDPDSTLERLLPRLERESDYIVVLSQMGREKDQEIADRWKEIDLIIGGHSQTLLEKPIRIGECRIVQAGKNGGRVGEIIVRFDGKKKVGDFSYKLLEVSERYKIPEDIRNTFEKELKL